MVKKVLKKAVAVAQVAWMTSWICLWAVVAEVAPAEMLAPKKMKPFKHPLKVTLEDIYNGKKTKIAVNRERICTKCEGKGGKDGAVKACTPCRGKGMVTKMQ